MVVTTIPLNQAPRLAVSQLQCPDCGNTVLVEVRAGSRVAVVCLNHGKYNACIVDCYSRNHEWEVRVEG